MTSDDASIVAVVTVGTDGVGKEIASGLAARKCALSQHVQR